MVVAGQMQHPMHDRLGEILRVLGADHHIPKLSRPRGRPHLVDRERQNVRGRVEPPVLAIQLTDPPLANKLDSHVRLRDPHSGEGGLSGAADQWGCRAGGEHLDLQSDH